MLMNNGCVFEYIFIDKMLGVKLIWLGLDKCFDILLFGDILIVWWLDCFGCLMFYLINLIELLVEKDIGFKLI